MSRARISLPHEHGGYLTLAGGAIAAVAVSPKPLVALAAALAICAAFFARGPLEQLAFGGREAAWDRLALVGLAIVATLGSAFAAFENGARVVPAVLAVPAIFGASYAARLRGDHRSPAFELLGMAALGASSGLMMVAGSASLRGAAACGALLGVHAAVAVPLVRSELRPAERGRAAHADRIAILLLACGAAMMVGLGAPHATIALAPRVLQVFVRQLGPRTPPRPAWVGLRETASLATAVALIVLLI